MSEPGAAGAPSLELRGLSVRAEGRPVVEGLDLALRPGERALLAGHSGSGKSTLLRVAAKLAPPAAGEVVHRAARIAFVFQEGGLVSNASLADNLLLPLFYRGLPKADGMRRVTEALARFGLDAVADERPGSLVAESRLLAQFARADALGAELLFVEPPEAALEPENQERVRAWLEAGLAAGKLAVMLTASGAAEPAGFPGRVVRLGGGELAHRGGGAA